MEPVSYGQVTRFNGRESLFGVEKLIIGRKLSVRTHWARYFLARNISRFPGGPGRRSTEKPTVCIARRTLPLAA